VAKEEVKTPVEELNLRLPADSSETHYWVNRQIRAHSRLRSEVVEYQGPVPLEFFLQPPRSRVELLENGGRRYLTEEPAVTTFAPAKAGANWLLVFRRHPEEVNRFGILPIEDNLAQNPAGSVQFLNLSRHDPLLVSFDNTVRQIRRGETTGFRSRAETGDQVVIQLADPKVNAERAMYSNMWYHESDRRFLILVTDKTRSREGVDLKVIRQ
jgi:hypothetical protein